MSLAGKGFPFSSHSHPISTGEEVVERKVLQIAVARQPEVLGSPDICHPLFEMVGEESVTLVAIQDAFDAKDAPLPGALGALFCLILRDFPQYGG